jgi:molecular chaperone HscB
VCQRCEAIQPLPQDADLFSLLALPRRLDVDPVELEQHYHAASRMVHPDRYQTAGPRERALSLEAGAAVNGAYRTLRDPVARGRYWLQLHGASAPERSQEVPPVLAAMVFEAQEKLEMLRAARARGPAEQLHAEVVALRDDLAARLDALQGELSIDYARWDASASALVDLKRRLSEIAYLRTLLGDVEETIGEGARATDHRH